MVPATEAPTESTRIPAHGIELWIDSRLENLDLLGAAVRGIASSLGLDEEGCYHLELCAVEAVSNSIRHAYHGTPGNPVRLQIAVDAERIELRVADRGTPIPEERRAAPSLEVDPLDLDAIQEGGRGIFLMHELMDEVSFHLEDGWNIIALAKRRPQP